MNPSALPLDYVSTTPNELQILIGTGAPASLTPRLSDFIHALDIPDIKYIKGFNGKVSEVKGKGIVLWTVRDQNGMIYDIETPAYYVPGANKRLFSPQTYIMYQANQGNPDCKMTLDPSGITFQIANGRSLSFPMQQGSNLSFMLMHAR